MELYVTSSAAMTTLHGCPDRYTDSRDYLQPNSCLSGRHLEADREPCSHQTDSVFHAANQTYHLRPPLLQLTTEYHPMFEYGGKKFNWTMLRAGGVCQPTTKYCWGFSQQLLFGFGLTTLLVACLLCMLWRRGALLDPESVADDIFGSFKTAVVVSAAIDDATGSDCSEMSDASLRVTVKAQHCGVAVVRRSSTEKDSTLDNDQSLVLQSA